MTQSNDKYTPEQQAALDEAHKNLVAAAVRGDSCKWDDTSCAEYDMALKAYNETEDSIEFEIWIDSACGDDDPDCRNAYMQDKALFYFLREEQRRWHRVGATGSKN